MAATEINLDDTSPAAPANTVNLKWQKGAQTGTDPTNGLPIYNVSGYMAAATTANLGVVRPDGNTITIANGVITAGSLNAPIVIGFVVGVGTTGNDIGPLLVAPRTNTVSKCVVAVKASDATTPLTFRINQNGTD